METKKTAQERAKAGRADQHEKARDGRKADPRSTAPYGIEEHMNEEQTKKHVVDRKDNARDG